MYLSQKGSKCKVLHKKDIEYIISKHFKLEILQTLVKDKSN